MGLIRLNDPESEDQRQKRRIRRRGIKAAIWTSLLTIGGPIVAAKTGVPIEVYLQLLGLTP